MPSNLSHNLFNIFKGINAPTTSSNEPQNNQDFIKDSKPNSKILCKIFCGQDDN